MPASQGRNPRKPVPWLRWSVASAAIVAGLSYLADQRARTGTDLSSEPLGPAVLVAPPPSWQPIRRAAALYALDVAEPQLSAVTVEARRHVTGAREDKLVAGAFGDSTHLRLSIAHATGYEPPSRFFIELVRSAAEANLSVVRTAQAGTIDTKFGPVEMADAVLENGVEAPCMAFRFTHPDFAFRFHGWLCGSEPRPLNSRQLACVIDRLALANGVDDPVLRALFGQADRRRTDACGRGSQVASARK